MTEMNYKSAFKILQENANKLRLETGDGFDIDSLQKIMSESAEAYKTCLARISAVKQVIEQYTNSNDSISVENKISSPPQEIDAETDDFDFDDIKF